jgi:hypothetical protein
VHEVNVRVFATILNVLEELTLHTIYVPFAVHPFVEPMLDSTVMGLPGRIPWALLVETWMLLPFVTRLVYTIFIVPEL